MNFSDRVGNNNYSRLDIIIIFCTSSILKRMLQVPMSLGKGVSKDNPIKIDMASNTSSQISFNEANSFGTSLQTYEHDSIQCNQL